jgi:predicted AAA+ superfamily ATPase
VLLTGARGSGKSSLVKALLNAYAGQGLRLIEVEKDDLVDLPDIVERLVGRPERFIVFCDDLSFEPGDARYKALKVVLDGSLAAPPENVLIYATSNRRHLMPDFFAFEPGLRNGTFVAAADLDGDGAAELVVGAIGNIIRAGSVVHFRGTSSIPLALDESQAW